MADERVDALRSRYASLGTGELAAAATFSLVAVTLVGPRLVGTEVAALWSALTPLLIILVQAGAFWLLARRYLNRSPMPAVAAATYRAFRFADVVLLVAGLVGVLLWWPERPAVALGVVAIWVFGAVEYLNYFVVRLSYPPRRWFTTVTQWRTPRLVQDLRGASGA